MGISVDLNSFMDRVMHIRVLRMNGAAAGIIGSSGVEFGAVQTMQRSALEFATEYRKSPPSQAALRKAAAQLSGGLQTLGLLGILSEQETSTLVQHLQELVVRLA